MGRTRLDCPIRLGGRAVRSETQLADGGPYALCLSTTLPDRAIALHSTYLGHPDAAETLVSHLALRGEDAETEGSTLPRAELPVAYARRGCLYDHLQRLQDLLEAEGLGPAGVAGLDEAALLVEA